MPPPPFEARFTLRSLAPRLAAWAALAAVSVVFAWPSGPLADLHFVARALAWGCAALFLFVLFFEARRLASKAPVLRIDERGILWRRWSEDTIPWSEVASLRLFSIQRVHFVGLVLRNPERFPSSTILGRSAKANRSFTGCDLCLEIQGTDRCHQDLVSAVESHLPTLE
ncbi:MAG: hypothetical protein NTV21_10905 [Planctomycetota bacterium]|nr:hypothetical protein [Planctomycetota bacterium]